MSESKSNEVIISELKALQKQVDRIEGKLDKDYVTQDELKLRDERISLLQKIVYGVVGLILTTVALGIVNLVITR